MSGKTDYLIDLNEIPKEHRDFFSEVNRTIKRAIKDPGKIKRCHSGCYYVAIEDEIVLIDNQKDEGGEWVAIEQSPTSKWYSDPFPTLKQLKESLGI